MPKTAHPDRRKNNRSERREPSESEETTLSLDRVTRVVAGGRRMRFRAVVVVGNKKGKVGLGTGKANEVRVAVQKAVSVAKRNMIVVPMVRGTIPHAVEIKFKASRLRLLPAMEGTGIIAGGALRVILDHAGVKNVLSKRYGTTNKLVNAQAVMLALLKLRPVREKDLELEQESTKTKADAETLQVKEVSRKDIKEHALQEEKPKKAKEEKKAE
jgi:small subunit ribosomal protein S5